MELNRHYAFAVCSPSRVSLMTGRLPYHANQANLGNCDPAMGAPDNMTMMSTKLKSAGFVLPLDDELALQKSFAFFTNESESAAIQSFNQQL